MNSKDTRRNFIKTASIGTVAALTLPQIVSAAFAKESFKKVKIETYIADYHKLIDRTKTALPNVKLVICEPFALKGVKAVNDTWYPTFDLFRKAARDIASEYNTAFVPWQTITDKALELAPANY